jgi:hypothetical protein
LSQLEALIVALEDFCDSAPDDVEAERWLAALLLRHHDAQAFKQHSLH